MIFSVTANAHKASNNGGWQWAASTGTDAQPYFRVFNPLLQSKRFDPKGDYIKKYVPELRSLKSVDAIHDPAGVLGKKKTEALGYFCRIVDHDKARKRAIEAFQVGKKRPQEDSTDSDDSDKPKKVSKKK
jgi:deoxyribodipyrimidine photo-lyase